MSLKIKYLQFILLVALTTSLSAQTRDSTFATFLQHTGDVIQIGLPITSILVSLQKKDKEGLKYFAYAFTANMATTHILKRVIRKQRPNNSPAYNAFPSGHTSAAFQAAAYLHKRYGWHYGVPSFTLATIVGYSRIAGVDEKHDVIDVVGGAALGILSSYIFTKNKYAEMNIYHNGSTSGLSLSIDF